jgi:hypothetical protein
MMRVLLTLIGLCAVGLVYAHPLGNNTVNRQAAIQLSSTSIAVHYWVELAEIPTLLAVMEADANADGIASTDEWRAYAQRYAAHIRDGIETRVDGVSLALTLKRTQWKRVPGAAGLDTLRIEAHMSARLDTHASMNIEYRDQRRPDEAGWKEVFLNIGSGLRVNAADVPQASLSRDLSVYPEDGVVPNVLAASLQVTALPLSLHPATPVLQAPLSRARSSRVIEPPTVPQAGVTQQAKVAPIILTRATVAVKPHAAPVGRSALQAGGFFRLGVHHIAMGWDHLLFLLGLIVAQASLRRMAWVITAFTIAHSLTLGLAASGLVTPPGNWVEPAIALTIAYVGLSNLLGYTRHGAALAFAFGLVHGFGFAGALAASMGNLRTDGSWLLNLAAFNLGIEAFQLGLVLLLLPLLRLGARFAWFATARHAVSLVIMAAGASWFFSRV